MGGAWSHRIIKDEHGKLHFAAVRFRPDENHISGATDIWNTGNTVDDMRSLARELLAACDRGIIDLADGCDIDADEDEHEDQRSRR